MSSPIFFDVTGRRRRIVGRFVALLLIAALVGAALFASTIANVPAASPLEFGNERAQPLPFKTHLAHLRRQFRGLAPRRARGQPLRIGFYVPWDEQSAQSLQRHYDQLDWVVAGEGAVIPSKHGLVVTNDPTLRSISRSHLHQPGYFLMIQNVDNGHWFGPEMRDLMRNGAVSDRVIDQSIKAVKARKWQGAVFDIENLPADSLPFYRAFLARAHPRFKAAGLSLALTVPAGEASWDLRKMASAVDHVYLMDYDEHWQGGTPGPIASQDWFATQLASARRQVPAAKLIVALGNYGYDWHDGVADALTVNEAWLSARDSGTVPVFDPASGNSGFAFDDGGHKHTVWLMDAATSWNELTLLGGVEGVALWRLGSEDPGFWEALDASRSGRLPQLSAIPPDAGNDVEGSGEILRIGEQPRPGHRTLRFDRATHAVTGESFDALPSPYQVQRTGASDPKALAITFDDGPDADYTPKILSVLEREHVPATFFLIGENALDHPEILQREARDGDELGNHSYTHPNMAEESRFGTLLELNATQRLIEAYTGRSTRLFRAPYFGDAEPTTADELVPAMLAQQRGYTIVGLHVDPGDWRKPGVQTIIDQTLKQVASASPQRSENIILLHDGGGSRAQTVAALPVIIEQLKARGYHFVPVSQLAGLSRDAVMPKVTRADRLSVMTDVAFFVALATASYTLKWIFFFAIALGIARALFLTALALVDRKADPPALDAAQPAVSVIIPAYNEERVIVESIRRVLASDYPALELIVADDGSKDATSALVAQHYAGDPRVRLMTMANGGKARALNRAIATANGEIIIALDADTQFLPDTISRLVRWFAEPKMGAVAGNARVGNRVNLVTRWQAVEYVTSQNVERRALAALGAITVVPGAVGAWRRAALDAVGGYPEDTLAEDQDLTIAIQRQGWRVAYDVEAIAFTEAPQTFGALGRQRYRWSFGTLQCLWKHRAVLRRGRPRGLAWFGMPQAWLFQIVFAALSPVIDLALLLSVVGTIVRVQQHGWAQTQSDVLRMGLYWIAFVTIDVFAGWVAYKLEPGRQRFPAFLMVMQRFVYRQLMYSVVLRSIGAALQGKVVGWGKLERTGTVSAPSQS